MARRDCVAWAERGLPWNIGVAKSGSVREHGLLTNFDEKVDMLDREKAGLRSVPAEIGA